MITITATVQLGQHTQGGDEILECVLADLGADSSGADAPADIAPIEHITGFVDGEQVRLVFFVRHGTRTPDAWVRTRVVHCLNRLGYADSRLHIHALGDAGRAPEVEAADAFW